MKRALMAVFLLLLIAAGCGQGQKLDSSDKNLFDASTQASKPRLGEALALGSKGQVADDEGAAGATTAGPAGVGPKIINNAFLEIRIAKGTFDRQFTRAATMAEALGGFVSKSSSSETKGRLSSGSITLRVPAESFQEAIAKLKRLGKVTSEDQSGRDVTAEFVDLEARLRHAKTQEGFFLKLMEKSQSISDLVQVQGQLSNVQLQIEQLQGQLQLLKDQTSYSTVTVQLFEPGASRQTRPKGLGRAFAEAWDGFVTMVSGVVVAAGWVAPIAILVGLAWLGFGAVRRRRRKAQTAPDESVKTTSESG